MAGVTIDSGPVAASDFLRDVPQEKWLDLMQVRKSFLRVNLPYDCRSLLQFVEDGEQMFGPLGFTSTDDFIERGLGLNPQDVAWAVDGLRRMKPDEPITFKAAMTLGQREIGVSGGKAGPGRGKKTDANGARLSKAPNSIDYITARLDRDGFTELAAKVRAKEMSARAAGIEAGFIKPLTPLYRLRGAWKVATEDDRRTFLEEVQNAGSR